jgi:hypothetical protein
VKRPVPSVCQQNVRVPVVIPVDDDWPRGASLQSEKRPLLRVLVVTLKIHTSPAFEQSFLATSEKMEPIRIATIRTGDHVSHPVTIEIPEPGIK